ncbi:MAG: hypothetical protein Q9166_004425 [cf. Caloplaca sp. 2 TL-2023]
MAILEPWVSWTLFGAGVTGAYLYYSRTDSRRRGRGGTASTPSILKRRISQRRGSSTEAGSGSNSLRRKSQPTPIGDPEASSSALKSNKTAKAKNRKGGNTNSSQLAQSSALDVDSPQEVDVRGQEEQGEEIDNQEFAKQMSGLKTGTTITKQDGPENKTKKQGKQAELPLNSFNALSPDVDGASRSKDLSNASSTTGADADDDLSPTTSPPFGASQAATSGDVSDMLEAPTEGPSVLRLTGVEEPKRQYKPQKVLQEAETKKQRQNRRKNEEKKLAKEEAERERRVLLEKQLRTAREAEGRPAKNGMGSAPATNAWSKPSTNNVVSATAPSSNSNGPLLDTFDENAKPKVNGQPWHGVVPSEEEQMRILSEMEGNGGWSTVKTGKKRKAVANNDQENQRKMSTTSVSVSGTDDQSNTTSDDGLNQQTPSQSQTEDEAPQGPAERVEVDRSIWNHDNIKDHPKYDRRTPHALLGHPGDSDWAVV